jgi:hypothetical protein
MTQPRAAWQSAYRKRARNRKFVNSLLEGDGFEPSVPRQKNLCNIEIAADREPGVQKQQQISQHQRQRKLPSGDLPATRL